MNQGIYMFLDASKYNEIDYDQSLHTYQNSVTFTKDHAIDISYHQEHFEAYYLLIEVLKNLRRVKLRLSSKAVHRKQS